VAAFFAMPRAAWAPLVAALFAADLGLSALTGHPLVPSAWLAGLSLVSTLGIAWLSQRYAQGRTTCTRCSDGWPSPSWSAPSPRWPAARAWR